MTVSFDGGKLVFAQGDRKGPATTYTIDPSKNPKAIDIGTAKGIYAIDGDSLKLNYFIDKAKDDKRNVRPADFETKEGDGFASDEFKRKKQCTRGSGRTRLPWPPARFSRALSL